MLPQIKQKNNNTIFSFDINVPKIKTKTKTNIKQTKIRPDNNPYIKKNNFLTSDIDKSQEKKLEIETNINGEITNDEIIDNENINDELYYEDLTNGSNSDDDTINLQSFNSKKNVTIMDLKLSKTNNFSPQKLPITLSTQTTQTTLSTQTTQTTPLQHTKLQRHIKSQSNNKINITKPKNDIIEDAIALSLLILKLQFNEYNIMSFDDLNSHCNKLLQSNICDDYNKIYLAFNILSNGKNNF
jgi:hypothetical protein